MKKPNTGFLLPGAEPQDQDHTIPSVRDDFAGQGASFTGCGAEWHLPEMVGTKSGDPSDDWHAERMQGRGTGWRSNWRLNFND